MATKSTSEVAMQRLLRINLKPMNQSSVYVLRSLDKAFSERYKELERGLPCKDCENEGVKGKMTRLDENLQPLKHKDYCDGFDRHNLNPEMKSLLIAPGKVLDIIGGAFLLWSGGEVRAIQAMSI